MSFIMRIGFGVGEGGSGDGEEDDGEAGGVAAAPDGELAPSAHKSRLGFGMVAGPAQQRGRRLDRGQQADDVRG
jgi:hypothetical protein